MRRLISRSLFQDVFVIFTSGWRPHRSNYSADEHLGFESSPWNRRRIERKVNTQKFHWDLNWTSFTCSFFTCSLALRIVKYNKKLENLAYDYPMILKVPVELKMSRRYKWNKQKYLKIHSKPVQNQRTLRGCLLAQRMVIFYVVTKVF